MVGSKYPVPPLPGILVARNQTTRGKLYVLFTRNELAIRLLMYVDDMATPDSQRAWRNIVALPLLHWCEPSHASSWPDPDVVFLLSIVVSSLMNPRFLFCCCLHACALAHKRLTQADAKAHPLGNPKMSSRPQYLVAVNMFPRYITSRPLPCAWPTPILCLGGWMELLLCTSSGLGRPSGQSAPEQ